MKQGFVIHHNGPNTNLSGKPHSSCEAYWNGVRRYHMESKGWSDIAYSFGVCHHGVRFTGRGWLRNQFANGEDIVGVDNGSDADWYTVLVFLGWNADSNHPVDEEPSASMVDGVSDLIAEGRSAGRCGTRVLPHNAFKPKRCPGATFTRLAGQWDRAPLSIPGDEDMALSEDDKQWFRDLFEIAAGDRMSTSDGSRSDVWRWDRETVTIVRTLKAELAALRSAVSQLGAGGNIDYAKVEAAAEKAVKDVLGALG